MKKKYKVIFWILGIFLVLFVVANILLGAYAPRIIEQQLQQNLKLKCRLGKISLSLPFTVTLERLEIGELATIKKISLSPNLLSLLWGKMVIHGLTITEPVITLEQSKEGKLNLPVFEQKGKSPAIYLTSFNLRDGKIIFTDKKVTADGFQVVINKLHIKVSKVVLPITSLAANFSVSAELLSVQGETFGEVNFSGWLDYLARDLDAELEVSNLDVTKFSAYYGNFISNRKLNRARLDLTSNFKAKHNALQISSKLNLSDLVYADTQQQPLNLDLAKNALDIFTDTKGNLRLEFDIDTQLDNPALSQDKIKSIILKAAMKNLANQSPQQLMDKVTSVLEQYGGLGKELKAIFN